MIDLTNNLSIIIWQEDAPATATPVATLTLITTAPAIALGPTIDQESKLLARSWLMEFTHSKGHKSTSSLG